MEKKSALFIIFWTFIGLVVLASFILILWSKKTEKVSAQTSSLSFCDEPIPTGEVIEKTMNLMADIYRELENSRLYLSSVIEGVQGEMIDLYKDPLNPENVCNFSACKAQVTDSGPELGLNIDWGFGFFNLGTNLGSVHIPLCKPEQCIGEPCADLEKYEKDLKGNLKGLTGSYEIVKDILNEANIIVTDDILKPEEVGKGQIKITRAEEIERKLRLVRQWLHPTFNANTKTCVMNNEEKKAAIAGEAGVKLPIKCLEAIEAETYWPRVWSEKCSSECKESPEKCVECLKRDYNNSETASFLAKINYKIFSTCALACDTELDEECQKCLCCRNPQYGVCPRTQDQMAKEECFAWFCGGSAFNFVCCHQTSLTND